MVYDVVVIGAGLAGFSAALAAVNQGKQAIIVAKGMGNLYSASGYIDVLGYYPIADNKPVLNPLEALDILIKENPEHPYALIGKEYIAKAVTDFLLASGEMGLPYGGTLDKNLLLPTAVGALAPTTFYPQTVDKNILDAENITVVGIKELVDFYPNYAADNLEKLLNKQGGIKSVWVELGLNYKRELNSYDLALALENNDVRKKLIQELKNSDVQDKLVLFPAVLGVKNWLQVIKDLENELKCQIIEIPTLPPSVMGYRLAEKLSKYLQKKGVDFMLGYPVTHTECSEGYCREIGITTVNGRLKKIKGASYVLASGGILGEGLHVTPTGSYEDIFDLPVITPKPIADEDFFDLAGHALAYAGIAVNAELQPINANGEVILENVHVAGATLAGYDPFIEKSGNGIALSSGYKAGILAGQEGK